VEKKKLAIRVLFYILHLQIMAKLKKKFGKQYEPTAGRASVK